MDLLKAREKAKKQQTLKKPHDTAKEKSDEHLEATEPLAPEAPAKKGATKIEKPLKEQPSKTESPLAAPPQPEITSPEPEKPSKLSRELTTVLKKIFDDEDSGEEKIVVLPEKATPSEALQLLIFRIGNELYGINLELVSEIIRTRSAAEIPNTPHYVHGLITLRGHMVPIINSHLRLNIPLSEPSPKNRIVIVEIDNQYMGFSVDEAFNVIMINKNQIKPPPPTLTEIEMELISGVYEISKKLIILLNTDNFFKYL